MLDYVKDFSNFRATKHYANKRTLLLAIRRYLRYQPLTSDSERSCPTDNAFQIWYLRSKHFFRPLFYLAKIEKYDIPMERKILKIKNNITHV